MEETNEQTVDVIKPNLIDEIVLTAYNRKQRRRFDAINSNQEEKNKIPFKVHVTNQYTNKNNTEFKLAKKEIALQFGSKTGKLKKKHLNRQLKAEGLRG